MGKYTLAFDRDLNRTEGTFSSVIFGGLGLIWSMIIAGSNSGLFSVPLASFEFAGRALFVIIVTYLCLCVRVVDLEDYKRKR